MSEYLIALILGIVEGLTEFLPISSTGHLVLTGNMLEFAEEKAKIFNVVIQVGAISSVLVLYRERFKGLFSGITGRQYLQDMWKPGLKGAAGMLKLGMVTFPILAIGFIFKGFIKAKLLYPFPVALAFAVGAVIILLIERRSQAREGFDADALTWQQAFLIGLVQCMALWPGMSRSASAIIGGMLIGFNRKAAAEFSFIAAVPALAAASAAEFLGSIHTMTNHDLELIAIGFVVSFFTAVVSVKWFIGLVSRWTLRPFAYYRLVVAAIVIVSLW